MTPSEIGGRASWILVEVLLKNAGILSIVRGKLNPSPLPLVMWISLLPKFAISYSRRISHHQRPTIIASRTENHTPLMQTRSQDMTLATLRYMPPRHRISPPRPSSRHCWASLRLAQGFPTPCFDLILMRQTSTHEWIPASSRTPGLMYEGKTLITWTPDRLACLPTP